MTVVSIQVAAGGKPLAQHPVVSGSTFLDVPDESLWLVLLLLL